MEKREKTKKRRPMGLIAAVSLALAAALVLAACAMPQAQVQQLDLRRLTVQQLDIGLVMDLSNPNDFQIPLERLDWGLALFDRPLSEGVARPDVPIPARGRERIEVPISINLVELGQAALPIINSEEIPWHINGTCQFGTPAGPINVDFSRRGQWRNPLR